MDLKAVYDLDVKCIGISQGKISLLHNAGFDSVGKLADASREELLGIKGMGAKSCDTIEAFLHGVGLSLKQADLPQELPEEMKSATVLHRNGLTCRSPLDSFFGTLVTVHMLKDLINAGDFLLYEIADGKGLVRVPASSKAIPEEYLDYRVVRMFPDHKVLDIQIAPRYFRDPETGEKKIYHTHHKKA